MIFTSPQAENEIEADLMQKFADKFVNPFLVEPLPAADAIVRFTKDQINQFGKSLKTEDIINSNQAIIDDYKVL